MGWFTLLLLRIAGWKRGAPTGKDQRGERYQAFTHRDGSYFHVYHEKRGNKVIRP